MSVGGLLSFRLTCRSGGRILTWRGDIGSVRTEPGRLEMITLRRDIWSADDRLVETVWFRDELVRVASNGDVVLVGGWVAMGSVQFANGGRMETAMLR